MSSSNTETRILQMQLDNKDFEDGVRRTIKSIEDLEEKLDLKNAGDGFQKVSAAANSVQMSHLESGLDTVTNKFTLMGQIGLQVLERISSKVVDTGEKLLRAATVQPMIDGWGEFEMKTNSVQTILGGIRNQFEDQPTAIHAISESLEELNEYADKTIYNFAQMTENVGKFTNQGISLKDSTNAIKGIANWAAAVGANPEQMSRAMYNISQSLGAGSMQLIDWRSIRFANMATPEVKKLFAEVAKIQGTISEDGKIKIGKKTLDVLEDFESTLKGGWLTNEVMAEAFSIYANAYSETELIEKYGEDLGKTFHEMGVYAEEAATKVRTFSQLMGVLSESLGSGWANTFDILFGGFEQQTEFLTAIKERIEEIINFQTEDRNTWLQNFSNIGGIEVFQDVILKTIDILSDFYWVFNDVAALVLNPFGDSVFNMSDGIFGPRQEGYTEMKTAWEGVKGIFDDISNTLDNFRMWMYTPNESSGRSPIHNLANALSGVAGVAGIAWQVLTGFGKMVFRLFKRFEPLVSSVLDLLGKVGGAIYNVFFNLTGQKSIEKMFEKIEKAVAPVIDAIVGFATAVVDLIHSFLGIDKAADDWTVLGERIQAFWDIFNYDPDLTFADNLKNSFKKALESIFGPETAESLIKGWDDNVAPVLEQISGIFDSAIKELEAAWNKFKEFLFGHEIVGKQGNKWREGGLFQISKEFFEGGQWKEISDSIQSSFDSIVDSINLAWANVVNVLFGHEVTGKQGNKWREGGLIQTIRDFFEGDTWTAIQTAFNDLIGKLELAWNRLVEFLFGHEVIGKQGNKWREGGAINTIVDFFTGQTWQENWEIIKGAFTDIYSWITGTGETVWNTIMDFLFGPEITGKQGNTWRSGGAYDAAIEFLNPVWDWISEKGSLLYDYITTHNFHEMWEGLKELLFGHEIMGKQGNTWHEGGVLTPIIEMLQPIADVFNKIKGWALEKISSIDWSGIWGSIRKLFTGYDELVVYDGGRHKEVVHHDSIFERIAGFFDRIVAWYDEHKGTFEKIFKWIGGLGDTIWNAFDNLLSGKGFGGFEEIGTYLKGGFDKLIGKIFPNGFSLDGILGGIFGEGFSIDGILGTLLGGGQKSTGDNATASGGFDLMKLLGLSADAAEADETAIADAANSVVAVLNDTEQNVGNIAEKGEKASNGILDAISPLLPYLGAAGGIALFGKVGDMITGITGNRKPTILEQIGNVIRSFGEVFKGLGIVIAAAGFSEWVSPGALDKVFDRITSLVRTVFEWIALIGGVGTALSFGANVGGGALTKRIFGVSDGAKVSQSMNFDSASSIISSIGEGIRGLFEGLQTLYDLVWEIMAADFIMGVDKIDGSYNFDKKLDRVLDLIGRVLRVVLENTALTELLDLGKNWGMAAISKHYGVEAQAETISRTLMGLGSFIEGLGDGIAAIMTASIIPGIMDLDTQKIVDVINAVFTGLNWLIAIGDVGGSGASILAAIKNVGFWSQLKTWAASASGLGMILGAIGFIAGELIDWYADLAEKHMTNLAGDLYVFASSLESSINALASLNGDNMGSAISVLQNDLPTMLRAITASDDDIGYDKAAIEERGKVIRDFGNRIKTGIGSLAVAKGTFDKYNTGSGDSFPLAFFKSMIEALEYLKNGGVKELYDEFFATGFGGTETAAQDKGILGITNFFDTMGHLGYAVTKYENTDFWGHKTSGTQLESTKQYLDDFQDAFSGIQTTFSLLVDDMGKQGFSVDKINSLANFMVKIGEAGKSFAEAYVDEFVTMDRQIYKKHSETSPIMNFGTWIASIGKGIRDFDKEMKIDGKYDINYSNLESALKAIEPLMEIEQILRGYATKFSKEGPMEIDLQLPMIGLLNSTPQSINEANQSIRAQLEWESNTQRWIDDVMPKMSQLGQGLHSLASEIKPEDIASLTSASGTLNSLAVFMAQDLYSNIQIMTTEQIQGYATAFGELKQSLLMPEGSGDTIASTIQGIVQATGGKPISLSIVPIIDDSNLGGNLPDGMQMDNTYSRMISMQMNMEGIQNVRIDSAQIEALVKANNATRDKIDTLATSIRNIRIQINPTPGRGGSYGPVRTVETYPLVANYQSPFEDTP